MTDAGLENLKQARPLRALGLSGTSVTHVGLRHLVSNTELLALDLELCDGVTDEASGPLSNLNSLNLTGAQLSDSGLGRLQVLTKLKTLRLVRTRVSEEGLRAFHAAVPGCEVIK